MKVRITHTMGWYGHAPRHKLYEVNKMYGGWFILKDKYPELLGNIQIGRNYCEIAEGSVDDVPQMMELKR